MIFFIRKNSTLPVLKYPLSSRIRKKYGITDEMFENVAVTFSMVNADTGIYKIANTSASIDLNDDRYSRENQEKFVLQYMFKEYQTNESGRFLGEFAVDFLGPVGCGKIKFPVDGDISIVISDSITKTTVV
jgi:hypothetical protein